MIFLVSELNHHSLFTMTSHFVVTLRDQLHIITDVHLSNKLVYLYYIGDDSVAKCWTVNICCTKTKVWLQEHANVCGIVSSMHNMFCKDDPVCHKSFVTSRNATICIVILIKEPKTV